LRARPRFFFFFDGGVVVVFMTAKKTIFDGEKPDQLPPNNLDNMVMMTAMGCRIDRRLYGRSGGLISGFSEFASPKSGFRLFDFDATWRNKTC